MLTQAHIITKQIFELVEPVLEEIGFELVDIEYLSKHGKWVLRLFIDKNAGVTIDDCARVSGEIGDLIDVKDIIEHEYVLEVSSPGLFRNLNQVQHFEQVIGEDVSLVLSNKDAKDILPNELKGQKKLSAPLKRPMLRE